MEADTDTGTADTVQKPLDEGIPGAINSAPDANDAAAGGASAGLLADINAFWENLRGTLYDHVQLVVLEMRRAIESLISILVYGIVAGVMLAGTWLAVVAAITVWLIDTGMPVSAALLVTALLNLCGAYGVIIVIRGKIQFLTFPATVQSLKPENVDNG
jgi:uncharacterized membrane protein YqjE